MFRFITKQPFWVNLLAAIVLVVGLLFVTLWALKFVTRHGEYERVPAVVGKGATEAIQLLEAKGFTVEIQDSIWAEGEDPGEVLKQLPLGEEMVKAKRTIYLTINRVQPPMVDIPNLVGLSFRNAELYLKQLGLKLGDTLRKADIAKDAVLEQLYNGQPVKPGTKVYYGSVVSLVLGSGLGADEMEVPMLIGLTFEEARNLLQGMGLNVGAPLLDGDVRDTLRAYIYKQSPDRRQQLPDGSYQTNRIRPGQSIDLWLGTSQVAPPAEDSLLVPQQ